MKLSSFTLIVIFVCLSLIGLAFIPLLPVKLSPSRTLPGLTVLFDMPGCAARVVETEATSRLEGMLSRVKGIKNLRSQSDNGSGRLFVEFDRHTDMEAARFEVSTLVRQLWPELPEGISYPQIIPSHTDEQADRPFITYTLNAPATPILIQRYGEAHIKPLLAQVKGINKVELSGATPMEWRLVYDNMQLEHLGLTVGDIARAINEHYDREFLGICQKSKDGEWLRVTRSATVEGEAFAPSAISLTDKQGCLISLDKLVKVTHTEEQSSSYYRINGLNAVYLSLTADEAANQLELAERIEKVMEQVRANLPTGYEIHTTYDATEYIRKELDAIYLRTGITVLILLLFVAVITRRLRYLFLIAASLAVNIAVALILYYFCGLEIQLYSLAGITISLNLVIDNTIVMADHVQRRHNLKAFTSILAATLTTIGALSVIFFLDEKLRLNLQDFAAVVIINLAVSLLVALFFVPSLIERLGMEKRVNQGLALKRLAVHFTHGYAWLIARLVRSRFIVCLLLAAAFGYSGWLFWEKVHNGTYAGREIGETVLYIDASLPNGSTVEQMNALVKKMENYLSTFSEIRQFQTSIYNARRASLQVYFKRQAERSGFPYLLKQHVVSKALTLGGGSWSVYGLHDQGFDNGVRESAGSNRIRMLGYNYDELWRWAEEMRRQLLSHRRIREVNIASEFSSWKDDYTEFFLQFDKERMAQEGLTAGSLFAALRPVFMSHQVAGAVVSDGQQERLRLASEQHSRYDRWSLMQMPFAVEGRSCKLADVAEVAKGQAPGRIAKENQQYVLCLQYEYLGTQEQADKLLLRDVELVRGRLPMGYSVERQDGDYWRLADMDRSQYGLLGVVVAVVFVVSSILFNSLRQPLVIIAVVPVSYIGVFLTFHGFRLHFDQGGFASLILLCGITVNASIYLQNEYNAIRRRRPRLSALKAYVKAWNTKVVPVFLTVASTILGFIPFMVGEQKEAFWFPLAAGTIGGLVLSVVGLFLLLPILTVEKQTLNLVRGKKYPACR